MELNHMFRHLWKRSIIGNMLFSYLGINLLLLFLLSLEEAKRPLVQFAGNYSVVALMTPDNKVSVEERIQHERNIGGSYFLPVFN